MILYTKGRTTKESTTRQHKCFPPSATYQSDTDSTNSSYKLRLHNLHVTNIKVTAKQVKGEIIQNI